APRAGAAGLGPGVRTRRRPPRADGRLDARAPRPARGRRLHGRGPGAGRAGAASPPVTRRARRLRGGVHPQLGVLSWVVRRRREPRTPGAPILVRSRLDDLTSGLFPVSVDT